MSGVGGLAGGQLHPYGALEHAAAGLRRPLQVLLRPEHERRHEIDRTDLGRALLAEERDVAAAADVADVAAGQAARRGGRGGVAGPEMQATGHHHRAAAERAGAGAGAVVGRGAAPAAEGEPDRGEGERQHYARDQQAGSVAAGPRREADAAAEAAVLDRLDDDDAEDDAEPRPADENGRADRDRADGPGAAFVDDVGRGAAHDAVRAARDDERAFGAALIAGEWPERISRRRRAGQPGQRVRAARASAGGGHGGGCNPVNRVDRVHVPDPGMRASNGRVYPVDTVDRVGVTPPSPSRPNTRPESRSGSSPRPPSGAGTPYGRRSGLGRRRAC